MAARPDRQLLVPVFFLSGATSLVYQTLWERALHLLLGVSGMALATVLAAFMAGLALGGWAGGKVRPAHPLRVYGFLELGIGAYAVAFPVLLAAAEPVYVGIHQSVPGFAAPLEALLAGLLLLPPTVAMGATLPLLARVVVDRIGTAAESVSVLYAANTLGAVLGTFVAGLVLLPTVGFTATNRIAAAGNVAVAVAALVLDPRFPPLLPADDLHFEERPDSAPAREGLVVAFLCGAAGLASEVVWTRMVALMLGATTYAFTSMLLAVLLGIGVGSRMGGTLADDALRYGGIARARLDLAGVALLLAFASWGLPFAWPLLPYGFVGIFDLFDGAEHPIAVFLGAFACCTALLFLPAVGMGAAFSYAVRVVAGDDRDPGAVVGGVSAANTLGGVVGALLAAFVGIELLGLRGVAQGAAVVYAVAALVAAGSLSRPYLAAGVVALGVSAGVQARWDPLWMNGGLYQYVGFFTDHSASGLMRFTQNLQELLYVREGRSSVVTVGRNVDTGNLWLANNGKVDASSAGDLPTQVLVSLLGAQYVEHPDDVLVIGLASGISAGSLTLLPGLGDLEVVELEPAIAGAAELFTPYNFGILHHPKARIVWNDGRNHVLRAPDARWDLVVSEPSNPYLSGVSNLFTEEFWRLGRRKLKPGGVWAQWIQIYGMGPDELDGLVRTFAEVYPHVAVYEVLAGADIVLLGSDSPLEPSVATAERLFATPELRDTMAAVHLRQPLEVVALHAFDRGQALAFAGDTRLVTDDNLRVEYAAPLWLHQYMVSIENWERITAAAEIRWGAVEDDPLAWLDLADAYDAVEDPKRAKRVRARAWARLPPGSPLQEEVGRALQEE